MNLFCMIFEKDWLF